MILPRIMNRFRIREIDLNKKLRHAKKWGSTYSWHWRLVGTGLWRMHCSCPSTAELLLSLWSAPGSWFAKVSTYSRGCFSNYPFLRFNFFKNFSSSLDVSGGLILKFYTCQGLTFQLTKVWKVCIRVEEVLNTGRRWLSMWYLSKCLMK